MKAKRKKSFGIYWEGDDTFNLKVPRVGDRGVRSSPWLCGARCCFCSLCSSWSIDIGGCGSFFHLQAGIWGQGTSHTLHQWRSCTVWWGVWSCVCAVGLTISVVGACLQHLRCSGVCSAQSVLPFSGSSQGWRCACRCGGPTLHMRTQWWVRSVPCRQAPWSWLSRLSGFFWGSQASCSPWLRGLSPGSDHGGFSWLVAS